MYFDYAPRISMTFQLFIHMLYAQIRLSARMVSLHGFSYSQGVDNISNIVTNTIKPCYKPVDTF
ncbi:hypothetical protein Barb4_00953 [Bacteroidales bacterium Barb4]|nr:hypothetical protein Barb4_00953 [Bacteroidales bacterium Barb4]